MKSFRRWISISLALILSVLVVATISPASAQTTQPSSLVVRVVENVPGSQAQKSYLLRASAEKAEPFDMKFDETATEIFLSPDGQWIAYTNYDENGTPSLSYGKQGQPATKVDIPAGVSMVLPTFSADSKYFSYSFGNFEKDFWELHIINLADSSQRVLGGKLSETMGAPSIVGWNPDGTHVYTLPIYLEGPSSGSPAEIDLSAIPAGDKPQPMPKGKLLLEDKYIHMLVESQFSNDASKLVFSFFDETRPVPNYQGMGNPFNTIGLYDVKSGETKIIYQAPKDQAMMPPVWSADGTKLVFQGGPYSLDATSGASTMVSPKLYVLDVATGKVGEGATLPVTATDSAFVLKVCGDTVFYTINQNLPDKFASSLYAAPLSDLTKQGKPLHTTEGFYTALNCVAQ